MKLGEPFNVSKVWPEVRIPLGMIKDRSISYCAKVIYGMLMLYAGSSGFCSVNQTRLAQDLGISLALVNKDIRMLKEKKYIMTVRQGSGRPAIYYFLWNSNLGLSTGGINRININPELHKNILSYYENIERMKAESKEEEVPAKDSDK